MPIKSGAGFVWTDEQAIWKDDTELTCTFGFKNSNGTMNTVYNPPSEPTNKTERLDTIMYNDYTGSANTYEYLTITLNGTGRNRNTFWGGSGGDVWVSANLTNYIAVGKRNWSNSLTSSAQQSTYKGKTAYYSPKEFTVVATNLNNLILKLYFLTFFLYGLASKTSFLVSYLII